MLFPDWQVSPAMRVEGAEGLGSPWALDAGVAWKADDALRVKLSGRVESGEAWLYAGVSLIDDVELLIDGAHGGNWKAEGGHPAVQDQVAKLLGRKCIAKNLEHAGLRLPGECRDGTEVHRLPGDTLSFKTESVRPNKELLPSQP